MSSNNHDADEASSDSSQLANSSKSQQEIIDRLKAENESLLKDKHLLESIITEKDKLIENLQSQLQSFHNHSNSPDKKLPARSQLRSVSNPIPAGVSSESPIILKPLDESPLISRVGASDISLMSDDNNNDETIIDNGFELQSDLEKIPVLAPPLDETPTEIPKRNPNHRIPPINLQENSPAKSVASSNYSLNSTPEHHSNAGVAKTPVTSPTRPTAQQAQYMGIPVSDMVWGSSPKRKISPNRGKMGGPLSPLRNQVNSSTSSLLDSPVLSSTDHPEDEFIFSPIGNHNGSSSTVRNDTLRNSIGSATSLLKSVHSPVPLNGNQSNSNNDLNSVVKYMDTKLSVRHQARPGVRGRASTVNTEHPSQLNHDSDAAHDFHTTSKSSLSSFKLPSDTNVPTASTMGENPFDLGPLNSDFKFVNSPHLSTKSNISTPQTRSVSTPTVPSSATAAATTPRMDNFTEEELKGLMVRPNDLESTLVSVISVIDASIPSGKKKTDDPAMTFGCFLVEPSDERHEIFKFCKTYSQLLEFDALVRPHFFELLPLPEVSSFLKTTPNTIEFRRQILNNYFYKLYELKIKPKLLALAICRFVSTDPLFKFDVNESIVKEGFMLRKNPGKLSATWRVASCAVYGTNFSIIDQATQKKQILNIPECKLINEEDTKDVRYAISILEPKKNVLSSSHNRILLCAECYDDKVEWLEALAKSSSNVNGGYNVKSSSESVLSFPSNADQSPDASLRYNNNSKISSPTISDAPATPLNQSFSFDDSTTLNSVSRPRKLGGLFSKMKDKSAKNTSPDKNLDGMVTPSTAIEPVTNLESYQSQRDQQYHQQPPVSAMLMSFADSDSYSYGAFSPGTQFSSGPELFGASLEEAIEMSSKEYKGRIIPSICYRCIDYLEKKDAIYSEGIFRLTGKSSEINILHKLFNHQYDVDFNDLETLPDVDSISTLLKRYLRSLRESVIAPELSSILKQLPNNSEKPAYYREKVASVLPKINRDLLYILLEYLIKVIENKEYNKMDINNITMLFSVNFNVDEDILSELIINFDFIFKNAPSPVLESDRPYLRR